jgi:glycosyltransferase involved in cell wall biosynthesis
LPDASAHLAIFIRSLGGGGGAERMMVNLSRGFVERGHRVDLVLGAREGSFFGELPDAVRVVVLGRKSPLRALPTLARSPESLRHLGPAFLRFNPHWILGCIPALVDYLHAETPTAMLSALNYSNLVALVARRIAGVETRLVVSERNTMSRRSGTGPRNSQLPKLVARLYPWADAISAVSDGVGEDLASETGIPRDRIVTTYNPVVTPEMSVLARESLVHPWFCSGSPPVILAAGKLKRQKGFDVLLEAFAKLRRELDARLVILGEGELRADLERRGGELGLGDDVELPGFVDNPFAYMARASLFVLSSRFEGLPGVLIQAMACGCPVVSTDCPSGPSEILGVGAYGALVPIDDSTALCSAMQETLGQPRDSERLVDRAAEYSLERSTQRYLELMLPGYPSAD